MYINLPCKNVILLVNIHMKNVNSGDFDTAYEYVNVYADDNGYVYRYLYMH